MTALQSQTEVEPAAAADAAADDDALVDDGLDDDAPAPPLPTTSPDPPTAPGARWAWLKQ
jgi:hypothetical protein